jgi:hypothetical protein
MLRRFDPAGESWSRAVLHPELHFLKCPVTPFVPLHACCNGPLGPCLTRIPRIILSLPGVGSEGAVFNRDEGASHAYRNSPALEGYTEGSANNRHSCVTISRRPSECEFIPREHLVWLQCPLQLHSTWRSPSCYGSRQFFPTLFRRTPPSRTEAAGTVGSSLRRAPGKLSGSR